MHEMRRARQKLPQDEAWRLLREGSEGVLSLVDAEGLPYGVPLNYVLVGETLYFHSALAGRKIDAIASCDRASFCVLCDTTVVPAEFTTYFCSVIAEGRMRVVEDAEEKRSTLFALGLKYNDDAAACEAEMASGIDRCVMLALEIEHVSGKEGRELAARRRGRE